jgi:hypothetical protein
MFYFVIVGWPAFSVFSFTHHTLGAPSFASCGIGYTNRTEYRRKGWVNKTPKRYRCQGPGWPALSGFSFSRARIVGAPSFAALAKGRIPYRSPHLVLFITNDSVSAEGNKCQGTTERLARDDPELAQGESRATKSCRKSNEKNPSLHRRLARSEAERTS